MNNRIMNLSVAVARLQIDREKSGIEADLDAATNALEIEDAATARARIDAATAKLASFRARTRRLARAGRVEFYQNLEVVFHSVDESGSDDLESRQKRMEAVKLAAEILNIPEKSGEPCDLLPFLKAFIFLIRNHHNHTL